MQHTVCFHKESERGESKEKVACKRREVLFFPACFLIRSCARTCVFPALPFLNLCLFVDQHDREKSERFMCGNCSRKESAAGKSACSETDWRSVAKKKKKETRVKEKKTEREVEKLTEERRKSEAGMSGQS